MIDYHFLLLLFGCYKNKTVTSPPEKCKGVEKENWDREMRFVAYCYLYHVLIQSWGMATESSLSLVIMLDLETQVFVLSDAKSSWLIWVSCTLTEKRRKNKLVKKKKTNLVEAHLVVYEWYICKDWHGSGVMISITVII